MPEAWLLLAGVAVCLVSLAALWRLGAKHERRPKHKRLMAAAAIHADRAIDLKERAISFGEQYPDASHSALTDGWKHVQLAIRLVVDCGCKRELWPEVVQSVIPVDAT